MKTRHTDCKLRVYERDGSEGGNLLASEDGVMGIARTIDRIRKPVDGRFSKEALSNARRLAHCWNMHDELVAFIKRCALDMDDKICPGMKADAAKLLSKCDDY